jgi:hypothetical protein
MTSEEKLLLTRASVFTGGIGIMIYGLGGSWIAILGAVLAASAVPGMLSRAGTKRLIGN